MHGINNFDEFIQTSIIKLSNQHALLKGENASKPLVSGPVFPQTAEMFVNTTELGRMVELAQTAASDADPDAAVRLAAAIGRRIFEKLTNMYAITPELIGLLVSLLLETLMWLDQNKKLYDLLMNQLWTEVTDPEFLRHPVLTYRIISDSQLPGGSQRFTLPADRSRWYYIGYKVICSSMHIEGHTTQSDESSKALTRTGQAVSGALAILTGLGAQVIGGAGDAEVKTMVLSYGNAPLIQIIQPGTSFLRLVDNLLVQDVVDLYERSANARALIHSFITKKETMTMIRLISTGEPIGSPANLPPIDWDPQLPADNRVYGGHQGSMMPDRSSWVGLMCWLFIWTTDYRIRQSRLSGSAGPRMITYT